MYIAYYGTGLWRVGSSDEIECEIIGAKLRELFGLCKSHGNGFPSFGKEAFSVEFSIIPSAPESLANDSQRPPEKAEE